MRDWSTYSERAGRWVVQRSSGHVHFDALVVLHQNVWFDPRDETERHRRLFEMLEEADADVIHLCEVTPALHAKLRNTDWIQDEYELGPRVPEKPYGSLLLSRLPVRRYGVFDLPSIMGRRLHWIDLGARVCVAGVHLESTEALAAARSEQLERCRNVLRDYEHVLFVGDFNFDAGAAEEALLHDFVDVHAALHSAPSATRDPAGNRYGKGSAARRIDRIWLRSLSAKAEKIDVLTGDVSDHYGLRAEISWPT